MKKGLVLIVVALMTTILLNSILVVRAAEQEIKIYIDGVIVLAVDVRPVNKDGRVFVPLRLITENLYKTYNAKAGTKYQLSANWDNKTKTVTVPTKFTHVVGTTYSKLQSGAKRDVGVASFISSGRTMVSMRLMAESLGCRVEWDATTKSVKVSTPEYETKYGITYPSMSGSVSSNRPAGLSKDINYSSSVLWTGDTKKDAAITAYLYLTNLKSGTPIDMLDKYLYGPCLIEAKDAVIFGMWNGESFMPIESGGYENPNTTNIKVTVDTVHYIIEQTTASSDLPLRTILIRNAQGQFSKQMDYKYTAVFADKDTTIVSALQKFYNSAPANKKREIEAYKQWYDSYKFK